jgi:hypothetical protein
MTERTFADEIAAGGSPAARGFELAAGHRPLGGHGLFLTIALTIYVLANAATIALSVYALWFLNHFLNNRFESEEEFQRSGEFIDAGAQALTNGSLALQIFCILAYCLFVYRAAANIQRSKARGMSNGPGWAVGWSFIPFANFVKIYEVMRDIWQASHDPLRGIRDTPFFFPIWYGCYLAGNGLAYLSARLVGPAQPDPDTIQVVLGMDIVSCTLHVVAGVLLIIIVTQITRAQAGWKTIQPASSPAPASPSPATANALGF